MPISWEKNNVLQALALKRPAEDSISYLQRLWNMDCPPAYFIDAARSQGFIVTCSWDVATQMPVHVHFH